MLVLVGWEVLDNSSLDAGQETKFRWTHNTLISNLHPFKPQTFCLDRDCVGRSRWWQSRCFLWVHCFLWVNCPVSRVAFGKFWPGAHTMPWQIHVNLCQRLKIQLSTTDIAAGHHTIATFYVLWIGRSLMLSCWIFGGRYDINFSVPPDAVAAWHLQSS